MALVRVPVRVEYDDGSTTDITADQRDVARFEAAFPDVPFDQAMERRPNGTIRYLAWAQQKRTGATDLEFDAWSDTVLEALPPEAYDGGDEADEGDVPDPGQPAAPVGA